MFLASPLPPLSLRFRFRCFGKLITITFGSVRLHFDGEASVSDMSAKHFQCEWFWFLLAFPAETFPQSTCQWQNAGKVSGESSLTHLLLGYRLKQMRDERRERAGQSSKGTCFSTFSSFSTHFVHLFEY